jgi:hypothetical protein
VFAQETFDKDASRGWLWRFVRRPSERLNHTKAWRKRDVRINATQTFARGHMANLE